MAALLHLSGARHTARTQACVAVARLRARRHADSLLLYVVGGRARCPRRRLRGTAGGPQAGAAAHGGSRRGRPLRAPAVLSALRCLALLCCDPAAPEGCWRGLLHACRACMDPLPARKPGSPPSPAGCAAEPQVCSVAYGQADVDERSWSDAAVSEGVRAPRCAARALRLCGARGDPCLSSSAWPARAGNVCTCPAPTPNRAPLLKRARCHSRYSTRCLSPTRTRTCRRGRDAGRAHAASAQQRRRRLGGCTRPASGVRKQTRWWQSNMQASKP
jgi:hypothetical protein